MVTLYVRIRKQPVTEITARANFIANAEFRPIPVLYVLYQEQIFYSLLHGKPNFSKTSIHFGFIRPI